MCIGISSDEGDDRQTFPDQISKANNADAMAKQAQMKITHLKKLLKVSCITFSLLYELSLAPMVVSPSLFNNYSTI